MDRAAIDRLLESLGERAEAFGIESLSEHEVNILLPWHARGVLSNGGFEFWYEASEPLAEPAARLRMLGFGAAADACDEVRKAVFPGGRESRDGATRMAITSQVDWRRFEPQIEAVYAVSWDDLRSAIARYVVAHSDAFGIASA
jgi:hypothetical protein